MIRRPLLININNNLFGFLTTLSLSKFYIWVYSWPSKVTEDKKGRLNLTTQPK